MIRVYLDHNATSPMDRRVLARLVAAERTFLANPSSLHTAGRRAQGVVEQARQLIATHLTVEPESVVFVSGGTEANNLAVLGIGAAERGVAASVAEHPSVLEAARSRGWLALPVDRDGRPGFRATGWTADNAAPAVVCAVYGQSEVGTLSDLAAARRFANTVGAVLHVDATQALGRVDLAPAIAAADSIALSLHKAGGPRGIGILVARGKASPLRPLTHGGGQEGGRRAGSVSPALASAAAATIRFAVTERNLRSEAMRTARDAFWEIASTLPGVVKVTPDEDVLPNTLMIAFTRVVDARTLLPALDLVGVDASQGSACSSGSPQPPPVLAAMGLDEASARRCVRFSFAHTTMRDAAQLGARRVVEVHARLVRA
ncbi:MAG: aminotransferase class V-fold PLP-dependent enzyme [Planctomycetota bacterium]